MGRWTQDDDDLHRSPDGMEKIGYDSDTRCYTFRDADGAVYEGADGGGHLRCISSPTHSAKHDDEPVRLMPNSPIPSPSPSPKSPSSAGKSSFHDFLPASMITAASPSSVAPARSPLKLPSPTKSSHSRSPTAASSESQKESVWSVVRRATMPSKMRNVVETVTRRASSKSESAKGHSYQPLDESLAPRRRPPPVHVAAPLPTR